MIFGKNLADSMPEHKWFAWYPIKINNGRYVWWEWVIKKPLLHSDGTPYAGRIWIHERII